MIFDLNIKMERFSIKIAPKHIIFDYSWDKKEANKLFRLVCLFWHAVRGLNPRPLGPEGWSDIFSGHFEPFLHLSTRKISQRRPFRHGSFLLIFPRLGHGLGQDRKPAAQKLRRCKQRIGGDADRGWKGSFVIRLLCWSFAKAPDTAADTVVPPEYPAYCRAICRSCRVA